MPVRPHYDDFADMPVGLREFMLSDELEASDEQLKKTYRLSDEETETVSAQILDAVFNDTTLPDALMEIKRSLVPSKVSDDQWKDFVADIVKSEIWPLRDLFGDELTKVLEAGQISTAGWPRDRIILKPLSFTGAASEAAAMAGFSLVGQQMRDRLKDLIVSKSKGIRTDEQVKEVLMRSAESAGLGLDSATADKTIAAMNKLAASTKILSDEDYSAWLDAETHPPAPPQAAAVPPTLPPLPGVSEDDKEIEAIKARMPEAKPATVLDQAVEEIFSKINGRPEDEYLARRLRYIISSRLRDVRSLIELKQLLQRDTKVGGLGLARDAAEAIATQIETGYATFHGKIMEEEKSSLEAQMVEQKQKIEERKKREAEEHARWYQEKVAARKTEEASRSKIAEEMKRSFGTVVGPTTEVHPMDAKEARLETQKFGALVPAVAAGAAAPAPGSPATGAPKPVVASLGPFTAAAPRVEAHPSVKVSTATVDLQRTVPTIRPRMDDIVSPPGGGGGGGMRLTGPVGELQAMTLAEFRRLSKNPQESAAKVLQKFDVLGQESFERRVEGIKAWMASPLQGAYMKLVSESLAAGKPVVQVAEEKMKSGDTNVPSPDEISAILAMNAKLHF